MDTHAHSIVLKMTVVYDEQPWLRQDKHRKRRFVLGGDERDCGQQH